MEAAMVKEDTAAMPAETTGGSAWAVIGVVLVAMLAEVMPAGLAVMPAEAIPPALVVMSAEAIWVVQEGKLFESFQWKKDYLSLNYGNLPPGPDPGAHEIRKKSHPHAWEKSELVWRLRG
jgi:hypothetical protein